MKIFIDGYGFVAHSILRKLIENFSVNPANILVNTYSGNENEGFRLFCESMGVTNLNQNYSNTLLKSYIRDLNPDYVLSLYGRRLLPDYLIQGAKLGNFNLHPSFLPDYKGCFSVPWAIINQEKTTGITIHEMTSEFDKGDILYQEKIDISTSETAFSLYHKLAGRFIQIFDDFFEDFITQKLTSTPMPIGGRYFKRELPFDGVIGRGWTNEKVDAFIRALHFPPHRGALCECRGELIECETFDKYKLLKNI